MSLFTARPWTRGTSALSRCIHVGLRTGKQTDWLCMRKYDDLQLAVLGPCERHMGLGDKCMTCQCGHNALVVSSKCACHRTNRQQAGQTRGCWLQQRHELAVHEAEPLQLWTGARNALCFRLFSHLSLRNSAQDDERLASWRPCSGVSVVACKHYEVCRRAVWHRRCACECAQQPRQRSCCAVPSSGSRKLGGC